MAKNKKYLLACLVILFIVYEIWTLVFFIPGEQRELIKYGKYSIATITGFQQIIKRRSFTDEYEPTFTFPYKGQIIKGRGAGTIQIDSKYQLHKDDIGKRYLVVFMPEAPQINSLLPYENFTDTIPDLLVATDSGQVKLIHPNFQKEDAPFDGWTKSQRFGSRGIEHLKLGLVKYE